jgi:hypothetical protein
MTIEDVVYKFAHARVVVTLQHRGSNCEAMCRTFPLGTPEAPDELLPATLATGLTATSGSWAGLRRAVESALTRDHGPIQQMTGIWRTD